MTTTAALILILAAIIGINVYVRMLEQDGQWHGTRFGGRMRRWVGGRWQYRDATETEIAEQNERRTW